jgi:hypothetical protein
MKLLATGHQVQQAGHTLVMDHGILLLRAHLLGAIVIGV